MISAGYSGVQMGTRFIATSECTVHPDYHQAIINATADDNSIIQVEQGYLTDKNGYFLLGASPATDGTFSPTGALAPLRVDQYAFVDNFSATTTSSMYLNLPAAKQFSEASESTTTSVVDSTGKLRNLTTTFSRTPNTNEWIAEFSGDEIKKLGFSVGIAVWTPGTGESETGLTGRADEAMYEIKKGSKGGYVLAAPYDPSEATAPKEASA